MPSKRSRSISQKPEKTARARITDLGQLSISLQLGGHQSTILYWGFYEPKYWRNYLHTHSFYEICYAWQGSGIFRMLGKDHRVKSGDLFIAKPGEPHEIISSRPDPLGIYYWAFSLTATPSSDIASSPIDALLDLFIRSTQWVASDVLSVAAILEMLTEEIARRPAGYPLAIDALITKLLLDTARAVVTKPIPFPAIAPRTGSEAEAIVATATRYIRDNLARPISLRDVAAQVHVSERHLGRLFHQVRQMTVLDFITQCRIETASQLLLDHTWAVKKIAAAVGYPDVRYFTTLFRKRTKMTPAIFRSKSGTAFANESQRGKTR
jgi:AraC family L-rhamnose operon transcriptional activator RhaR